MRPVAANKLNWKDASGVLLAIYHLKTSYEHKKKGCEIIACWIKGIRKHLYSCSTSTKTGFGSLIVATWNSILRHAANKQADRPNPLYIKCKHGELQQRKWIKISI